MGNRKIGVDIIGNVKLEGAKEAENQIKNLGKDKIPLNLDTKELMSQINSIKTSAEGIGKALSSSTKGIGKSLPIQDLLNSVIQEIDTVEGKLNSIRVTPVGEGFEQIRSNIDNIKMSIDSLSNINLSALAPPDSAVSQLEKVRSEISSLNTESAKMMTSKNKRGVVDLENYLTKYSDQYVNMKKYDQKSYELPKAFVNAAQDYVKAGGMLSEIKNKDFDNLGDFFKQINNSFVRTTAGEKINVVDNNEISGAVAQLRQLRSEEQALSQTSSGLNLLGNIKQMTDSIAQISSLLHSQFNAEPIKLDFEPNTEGLQGKIQSAMDGKKIQVDVEAKANPTFMDQINTIANKNPVNNIKINNGSGMTSVDRNRIWGQNARPAITELRNQARDYEKLFLRNDKDDTQAAVLSALGKTGATKDLFATAQLMGNATSTEGSLTSQINALKEYIELMRKAASIKGMDLSAMNSKYKTPDQIIKELNQKTDAQIRGESIQTGQDKETKGQPASSNTTLSIDEGSLSEFSSKIQSAVDGNPIRVPIEPNIEGFSEKIQAALKGTNIDPSKIQDSVSDKKETDTNPKTKSELNVGPGEGRGNSYRGLTAEIRRENVDLSAYNEQFQSLGLGTFKRLGSFGEDGDAIITFMSGIGEAATETTIRVEDLKETIGKLQTGTFTHDDYKNEFSKADQEAIREFNAQQREQEKIVESQQKSDRQEMLGYYKSGLQSQVFGNRQATNEEVKAMSDVQKIYSSIQNSSTDISKTQQEWMSNVVRTGNKIYKDDFATKQLEGINKLSKNTEYMDNIDGYANKVKEIESMASELRDMKIDFGSKESISQAQGLVESIREARSELSAMSSEYETMKSRAAETAKVNEKALNDEVKSLEKKYNKEEAERRKQDFSNYGKAMMKQWMGTGLTSSDKEALSNISSQYKSIGDNAAYTKQERIDFRNQVKQANDAVKNSYVEKQFKSIDSFDAKASSKVDIYSEKLDVLKEKVNELNGMKIDWDDEKQVSDVEKLISEIEKLKTEMGTIDNRASEKSITSFAEKLETIKSRNPRALRAYSKEFAELDSIAEKMSFGKTTDKDVDSANAKLNSLVATFKAANKEGLGFGQMVKQRMGSFGSYLATFASFYRIVATIKKIANTVKELDSAMIELEKVSDVSGQRLQQSFETSKETAQDLGATVTETINATADWSRLGYSQDQAEELAKVAIVYKHVGDGIDIDSANKSLISTLQGFKMEASDAMEIVDKFNEVANNEPIDSAGIGEALQRSAASFQAANTDLSESIALITSANAVVQDPSRVGNMWKTVSMRIRGATAELEEAGLETDGMAKSTSDLRDLVKSITGFDIMKDETTFKSIYDIILGIGKEWDNINDVDRSALLQKLAGKAQGNALAAALGNTDLLEEAYQIAEGSEGSAMREQKTWEKGVQARIEKLKATAQVLSSDLLKSDSFKFLIDSANSFLKLLDSMINRVGVLGTALGALGGIKLLKQLPGLIKSGAIGDWLVGNKNKPITDESMSVLAAANGVPVGREMPTKFMNHGPTELVSNYVGASGAAAVAAGAETAKAGAASEAAAAETEYATAATEGATASTEGAAAETAKAGGAEATATAMGAEAAEAGTVTAEVGATAGEMGVVAGEAGTVAGEMGVVATETGVAAGEALTFSAALSTMLPWIALFGGAIAGLALWSKSMELPTFDDKIDAFEKQKSNYDEEKTKLDDYKSQITDIDSKIQEINSHDKLTLTDEAELENLRAQKTELEQLQRIQQNKVNKEKRKSNKKALEAWNADDAVTDLTKGSYQFQASTYTSKWVEGKSSFEEGIKNNISKLREYQQQRQNILDEIEKGTKTQEDLDAIDESINKVKDSLLKDAENVQEIRDGLDQGTDEGFKAYQSATQLLDEANNAVSGNPSSPLSQMTSLLDNAFKGSSKSAARFSDSIKDYMVNAVKDGKNATDALAELGLTMDDLGIKDIEVDLDGDGNIDKTVSATQSLNKYFKDLAGSAKKAGDEINKIKLGVDGTFDSVKEAQESANQGANWDNLADWIKSGQEAYEKGLIGTDDFKTLAEFITPGKVETKGAWTDADAYADAWDKNLKKVKGYFDKDDPMEGMKKFLTDAENAKIANVSDDFSKVTTSFKTTAEAAKKMGVSVEVVEAMLGKLKEYGFEFDGVTESGQQLKDYNTELEKLKTLYNEMPEDDPRKKNLGNQIKGFNEAYAQYEKDLSQLDEEAVVHIKFEYDLSEIENKINDIEEDITNVGWTAEKGASRFSELENATDLLEKETGVNEKNNKGYGSAQEYIDKLDKKLKSSKTSKEDRENYLQRKEVTGKLKNDYQKLLDSGKKIDWKDYLGGKRAKDLIDNMAGIEQTNKDKAIEGLRKRAEKKASDDDKNETKRNLLPYNDLEKNRKYYNKNKKNMTAEEKEGFQRQWRKQAKKEGHKDAGINDNENLVVDKTESNKRIAKKNGKIDTPKSDGKQPEKPIESKKPLKLSDEAKQFNKEVFGKFIDDVNSGRDFRESQKAVDALGKMYSAPVEDILKNTFGEKNAKALKDYQEAQNKANNTTQEMFDIWDKNKGVELKPTGDQNEVPATRGGMPTQEETMNRPRGRKKNITGEGKGVELTGEGTGKGPVGNGESYLGSGELSNEINSAGQGFASAVASAGQAFMASLNIDNYLQNKQALENAGLTGTEQYGNVDIGNRQRVYWNEDTWNKYKSAIQSYNTPKHQITDVSQMGDYSTIWSQAETFDDNTTITFTPMLQGQDGQPEILSSDTMNNYVGKVIETAKAQYGDDWNLEENLLKADHEGIDRSELGLEGEGKVSDMFLGKGDIGEDAHLVEQYVNSFNDVKKAADEAGMSVEEYTETFGKNAKEAKKGTQKQEDYADATRGVVDTSEEAARVTKDVSDSVSTKYPGQTGIEVSVDKNKLDQELSSIDTNQSITYTANVDGAKTEVEAIKNEDGTVTYQAEIDGVKQEVEEVKNEDGTVTYKAKGLDKVQQDAKSAGDVTGSVKLNSDIGDTKDKNISVTANASSAMKAIQAVNSKKIKSKKLSITANAGSALSAVRSVASAVSNLPTSKTVTLTTNKVTNIITHKKTGPQEAHGTVAGRSRGSIAMARGSIGAYANSRLPLSSSFIKNNSIRQNETALVNEVGREGIVRNGRVMTVNGGRPGFTQLRKNDVVINHRDMAEYERTGTLPYAEDKQGIVRGNQFTETTEKPRRGDIVFTSKQLEELNKNGRISTYAKIVGGESAFASGTYDDVDISDLDYIDEYDDDDEDAYASGSVHAYAKKKVTGKGGLHGGGNKNTNNNKGNKGNKGDKGNKGNKNKGSKGGKKTKKKKSSKKKYSAADEFSKWLEKLFDWIEVTMDRLNRVTERSKTMAENAQTLAAGLKYTEQAINGTVNELNGARTAQTNYAAQATKIKNQSRAYAKKQNEARKKNKKIAKAAGMSDADEKRLQQQIKNNTFSIASFGKYRKSYIEAYREWYEKSLEMADKQLELEEQLRELYRQRLSIITEWYDMIGDVHGSKASADEAYIESQKARGIYVSGNEAIFGNRENALSKAAANSLTEYNDYLKEFQSQIRSGRITKGTKDYYNALNTLNGLEENVYKDNQALADFRKELKDISFENLKNAIDTLSSSIDLLTARNEHAENYGNRIGSTYELTGDSYQEVINRNVEQAGQYLKQYTEALAEQQKYEIGSEPWLDYREKAADAAKEVYSIRDGIIDLANSMRDVRWKNFNKDIEILERTGSELEDIRDLLNEDNLIAKNGSFTPEGLANVALLGKEIKTANQQIQRHRKAIEYLNEEYNNGVITLDELTEGVNDHQDSIIDLAKNVADYRQNVLDSYLDSLEKQNDLLNENISKRKEALDTMRDYYNYQRQIFDQTRNINYLEQQVLALQGTNDKSSRAKLASLQNELQAARRELADSQYEHNVDVRQQGYDKLADDANEALDRLTDDIKRSTELQNQIIDNMLNLAQNSYQTAYEQIDEIIKRHGIILSDTTNAALKDTEVQGQYFGDVTDKAKAFGEALDVDTSSIAGLVEGMESAKQAFLDQGDSLDLATKKAQAMSDAYQQLIKDVNNLAISEGNYNTGNPTKDQASVSKLDDGGSGDGETFLNGQSKVEGTNKTATGSGGGTKKTTTAASKKTATNVTKKNGLASAISKPVGSVSVSLNSQMKTIKTVMDYVNKYASKASKKRSEYSDVNKKIYDKTKGKILSTDEMKALAKKLGVTYNNAKSSGNLYKKLKSIGYFAKGSKYIPFDQLGVTQEKGQELIYKRADGTILTPLGKGDKIFTADMTDNLWKLAKMNTDAIKNNINGGTNNTINNKPTINLTFDNFINVEGNLDQNAVADLRQFKEEIIGDFTKKLTNDFGMFGHKLKF